MSEDEDLELLALQRQLDDAFQTTRPRAAFEDELWLRIQARRPIWLRFREGVTGLFDSLREAPAVPSAAVAVALIVLVGAGIFTLGGLHFGGGGAGTTAGLSNPQDSGSFGAKDTQLPAPSFQQAEGSPYTPVRSPSFSTYAGVVSLTWAGQLDVPASNLPVFRYQEPTPADADQFAASLGAAHTAQTKSGALGTYAGANFTLDLMGSVAQPAREPTFVLTDAKSAPATIVDPVGAATAYLAAHSLIPTWSYQTEVQTSGATVKVMFLRSFDLAQGQARLINGAGDPYGIQVDLVPGKPPVIETGPLPLSLQEVSYPTITADQAVRTAVASSAPAGTAGVPAVRLTRADLVYILVWAGDHSFYEPAFLFSGTFVDHGKTYLKRVLVSAVAPSFLSP